ncbi:hypothetical protein EYF80_008693 [Liparis tanakae]|uniref:Uncharacterized protein n=1 Tax=Liparis tanakae TaxID=230148 RepID=A0A4Z2ITF6_9TELE|nr:hypothetical protein EYF80_008693 [Liparis tanakae]
MENDWEPMKKRNSCVILERLSKDVGTIDHMLGKKRKGPQPIEGGILGGKKDTLVFNNGRSRQQHSLSNTVNHHNCGQAPAKQEHHQEKEGDLTPQGEEKDNQTHEAEEHGPKPLNLKSATMTVVLGVYRSIRANWSHSSGTTKFPMVMAMEGRDGKPKVTKTFTPETKWTSSDTFPLIYLAEVGGQEDAVESCCDEPR